MSYQFQTFIIIVLVFIQTHSIDADKSKCLFRLYKNTKIIEVEFDIEITFN